jgi:hypothetical protein
MQCCNTHQVDCSASLEAVREKGCMTFPMKDDIYHALQPPRYGVTDEVVEVAYEEHLGRREYL